MHILIVDDEKPARGELRYILQDLEPAATFSEARNGQEALQLISAEAIDVVFLDINMPGLDGITTASLLAGKAEPPLIIFATAYDKHAIKAFELAALDYIVKPFQEKRLAQSMLRVRELLQKRDDLQSHHEALRDYIRQNGPAQGARSKLWGELPNGNFALLGYDEIKYIEAEDKKVFARGTDENKLQLRYTIKELESRLAEQNFARIHKAYLVNLDYIAEVVPYFSGTYIVRLRDEAGTELPMSRQYGKILKDWLS
ncbi:MAG: response regulator transcription factor [Anaerolineales bacterium]|nr:response regulator transcription factor [Anaerolineales bacterium]